MTAAPRRNPGGGPLPRGRPSPTPRRLLVAAALASLLLGGCQSLRERNPLRGCCGGLGNLGNLFHRNRVVYEEAPLYTEPGVEVLPGAGAPVVVEPAAPIGSVPIEPGFNPSPPPITSPDSGPGGDLNLDPLDSSSRAPSGTINSRADSDRNLGARSPGGTFRNGTTTPTTGDLYADAMARRSEATVARARPTSTPAGSGWDAPAVVPADAVANARPAAEPTGFGLIANLPAPEPEDLPTPGPATPTPATPEPAAATPATPVAEPPPATPPAEPVQVPEDAAATPQPDDAAADTAAARPLPRFDTVEPMIAAGAMPADESGWVFLADHGYRTVIDLRSLAESRPEDFETSTRLGLRHIMLPMVRDSLNPGLVERFTQELAQESGRPIFFGDADGTGAAILWYVHRATVDGYDRGLARSDAARIAPLPDDVVRVADAYLDGLRGASPPDEAATPPAAPPEGDSNPLEPDQTASTAPTDAEVFADPFARPADGPSLTDPEAWKTFGALALSLLVVPLAYWSGSAVSTVCFRPKAPASLSAPSRSPKPLPDESDAAG